MRRSQWCVDMNREFVGWIKTYQYIIINSIRWIGLCCTQGGTLYSWNTHNSMNEKRSYYQYLAEPRPQQSCFDGSDRCRPRGRTNDQDELFPLILQKSESHRSVVVMDLHRSCHINYRCSTLRWASWHPIGSRIQISADSDTCSGNSIWDFQPLSAKARAMPVDFSDAIDIKLVR
jgi:hypothetical protein